MASPYLLSLLSLLSLLCFSPSSLSNSLSISLTPLISETQTTNPWQRLNQLSSSSLARAHHLKHPQNSSLSKISLSPQSYGGYSISLSFGSPPQTLPFVMDTGSSLVWFPCTHRYACTNCGFSHTNPSNISTFIPKLSSSAKILGCKNEKCRWVFGSNDLNKCQEDQICPAYVIQYGSGSTSGLLLQETLDFPVGDVADFIVGCSILSTRQPSGIAGFGRGPASLPAQMGLKKFSYCLVAHRFDDEPVSSELVLNRGSGSGKVSGGKISYTRFHKNLVNSRSTFEDFYYVNLRKITVGGKHVKIPYGFLVPGNDGNGGTIVDSGTTFTFMDSKVFNLVAQEFENQMSQYKKAADVEIQSGLRPCFDISGQVESVKFPELMFHFKGGAKLALPIADYFSFLGDADVVCMTMVSNNATGSDVKIGPSIIIGNYQQQNIYLEYDLENERLGFRKQICK